jgi:hypothetical protein
MIIAALATFGALLACWLLAASDGDAEQHDAPAAVAAIDPAAPDLARVA